MKSLSQRIKWVIFTRGNDALSGVDATISGHLPDALRTVLRRHPPSLFTLCLLVSLLGFAQTTLATSVFLQRWDVKRFVQHTNQYYSLPIPYIEQALSNVRLRQATIKAVRHPKESLDWPTYKRLFITPKRIGEGVQYWQKHNQTLKKAEKTYGIPQEIIVAILGVETNYGDVQGSYRVLDSLATLGFKYQQRADFFQRELANFLLLCKEQHWQPEAIYGSYAGAIGQPQFMPTSYRHFAVDFSGDGKCDLRHDDRDVIGSIANFLKHHGWQPSQAIAIPKRSLTKSQVAPKRTNSTTKHMPRLLNYGQGQQRDDWFAYPNFFVIMRYNASKRYALAVYQLAEEIKAQYHRKRTATNIAASA